MFGERNARETATWYRLKRWIFPEGIVSIRDYLHGRQFDGESVRFMAVAFEMTDLTLRSRQIDISPEVIAAKIVELADAGEHDPDRLCERALDVLSAAA
jgi:hypothetical protein